MAPAVFLINGLTKHDWLEALLFAVAVAVGLTPEMLPMIVTVNLAKGAIAMSREKVIVKRLNAIQNFGAMDILCTDKTGTLTQDRIILKRHLDIHGEDSATTCCNTLISTAIFSRACATCSTAPCSTMSICTSARHRQRLYETRRDSLRFHPPPPLRCRARRKDGTHLLICKGAVEEIFAVCSPLSSRRRDRPARPEPFRAGARSRPMELNADGFRVVAVAYKEMAPSQDDLFRRRRNLA